MDNINKIYFTINKIKKCVKKVVVINIQIFLTSPRSLKVDKFCPWWDLNPQSGLSWPHDLPTELQGLNWEAGHFTVGTASVQCLFPVCCTSPIVIKCHMFTFKSSIFLFLLHVTNNCCICFVT